MKQWCVTALVFVFLLILTFATCAVLGLVCGLLANAFEYGWRVVR